MQNHKMPILSSGMLLGVTIVFGMVLASSRVSAEDTSVVDQVNITVPVSCTLSGTGMDTHNANINNGLYVPDIGTTTLRAFCNDNEGFAIYAAGYTGDEIGGENSNKLVGTNASGNSTIESGLATTTGTPDISNWAMKLAITQDSGDTTGTNAFTIDSAPNVALPSQAESGATEASFSSYHVVPNEYVKVAHKNSGTDMTASTGGVKLTTTYAAYISKTQPADTYSGQVIYTLIHPSSFDPSILRDAVTVVFDGNGLTFPNGQSTNTMKFAKVRNPGEYAYVGDAVEGISKSPNVNNDGTKGVPIATNDHFDESVTIAGADKLKIIINYDIEPDNVTSNDANGLVNISDSYNLYMDYYGNGTETVVAEGDTVYFWYDIWGDVDENHNYGYYAQIYPVYNTEQPNTTRERLPGGYAVQAIEGSYAETTEWHDKWIMIDGNSKTEFSADSDCESDWCFEDNTPRGAILDYITNNYDELKGETINILSYNPVSFDEAYAAANKTKVHGYYAIQDLNAEMCRMVSEYEISTVIDIRDNNLYEIAKLNSGECWMRDDLRLDPTNSTVAAKLSASNTAASDDAIYNYIHGGNVDNNPGWSSSVVIEDSVNASYTEPKIDKSELSDLMGIKYNYCAISVGTYCVDHIIQHPGFSLCPINWNINFNGGTNYSGSILSLKVNSIYYWIGGKNSSPTAYRVNGVNGWNPQLVYDGVHNLSNLNFTRCIIRPSE